VFFVCVINSPKFDLPIIEMAAQARGKMMLTCHRCNEVGHKAIACPRASGGGSMSAGDNFNVATSAAHHSNRPYYSGFRHDLRPLDQVTCFKVIFVTANLVNQKCSVIMLSQMNKCFKKFICYKIYGMMLVLIAFALVSSQ